MTSLHLVSARADSELDAIRRRLRAYENVSGFDEVAAALQRQLRSGLRAAVLDLIGHSRAQGFLILGEWTIEDSPQTAASFYELRPWLQQLGVEIIRLLGCATATTTRSQQCLGRIVRATGCRVLGTKRFIGKSDYSGGGFAREDALVGTMFSQPRNGTRTRRT